MDEFKSVQATPQVQFNQKSFWGSLGKKLAILLALIILLSLVLVTLNYFHILPLSQLNFLSFLPTKQLQTIKQDNTIAQSGSLEISLEAAAKKTILTTLRKILNPSLNASFDTIQFTQDQKTKVDFSGVLDTKDGPASFVAATFPNGQSLTLINFSLASSLNVTPNVTPSASFAQSNIASVFKVEPKGEWGCQPLNDYRYCENFWEDQGVKKGVGVYGPITIKDEKKLTFFFCQFDQKNPFYDWKSCSVEFAKTGVK